MNGKKKKSKQTNKPRISITANNSNGNDLRFYDVLYLFRKHRISVDESAKK